LSRPNKKVETRRHLDRCTICKSPARAEIEDKFLSWTPQSQIAREYKVGRLQLYRHFRACGLFEERNKNVKTSLAHFIERGRRVRVTAAAYVQAHVALSKLDDQGRTIERVANGNENGLRLAFGRMTRKELREYAETGVLPNWFPKSITT
jgi:hypothetical protein